MSMPSGVVEGDGLACLQSIDIFVLAGGLGTRLRPVLGDRPKLLAPIGGRPYLAYLLNWLRGFGARRIVFGLGYQAEPIIGYLRDNPPSELSIETVIEPRPMGTAGAIRFARRSLQTNPVLVLNGDSYINADLCSFLAHHYAAGKQATILCAEVVDAGRYGRILLDENGSIQRFVEKDPTFRGQATINAGMYFFSTALLDDIAASDKTSLEHDMFERLPPGAIAAFIGGSDFIDIGTPTSLAEACRVLGRLDLRSHRQAFSP